ncbi:MAG: hypothetical protein CVU64_15890 [Deltaproteobacteria bacterium HGW-Deltaproteobacteria-21]|nr:MAG: hypothetical protein CVU64_15890 [Deltaproteobacteria bacterium HGW-Deltaproteobacteria-21]
MTAREAVYRLKVAKGFLAEASQDLELERWRSAVDNAQLAVENGAKAALASVGPVGRTHMPAVKLREALEEGLFEAACRPQVLLLAEKAEVLGNDVHVQTDYGDEVGGRTPWELFDESDAVQAVTVAVEAVRLAEEVIRRVTTFLPHEQPQ